MDEFNARFVAESGSRPAQFMLLAWGTSFRQLLNLVASLTDAERRLLARAYFRGLTAREIATADGIPLGTVKTRLRAAMIKVRRANEGKELP